MDPNRIALYAAALPAGVAAVVLFVLGKPGGGRFALLAALAAGFLAGHVGLEGALATPPRERWQWLPWIALAGGAAGLIEAMTTSAPAGRSSPLRWGTRAALAVFTAWACVLTKTPLWIGGVAAAVTLLGMVVAGAATRPTAATFIAAVTVVALATAVTLFVGETLRVATLCGALAAAAGACLVLSRWFVVSPRAAIPLVAAMVAAFLLCGVLTANVPVTSAVLLAAAPLGAWIPGGASRRLTKPWHTFAVRIAAVSVLAGAAVAVAVSMSSPMEY